MGVWADRTWLASQRWHTDMRIEETSRKTGMRAVGLWAKTWRWGDRVAEVCIHAHGKIDIDAPTPVDELNRISALVREACTRARAEFINEVPCQVGLEIPGGGLPPRISLKVSTWETANMLKGPAAPFAPDVIAFLVDGPEDGSYAQGIIGGLEAGGPELEFCDYMNPHAESRFLRDDRPARWQFVVRPMIRRINGLIVKAENYRITEIATRTVEEGIAGDLARTACARLSKLFAEYAPGGRLAGVTESGLPPGYAFWAPPEMRLEEDELEP